MQIKTCLQNLVVSLKHIQHEFEYLVENIRSFLFSYKSCRENVKSI